MEKNKKKRNLDIINNILFLFLIFLKLKLPTKIILLKYKRSSIRNTDSNIFKMKYIYKNINISISILVTFY